MNADVVICRAAIKKSGFACKSCRRGFSNRADYLDLTILEGTRVYDEDTTRGTELFRCVVASQLIEMGSISGIELINCLHCWGSHFMVVLFLWV
jgi:hypothetical protein